MRSTAAAGWVKYKASVEPGSAGRAAGAHVQRMFTHVLKIGLQLLKGCIIKAKVLKVSAFILRLITRPVHRTHSAGIRRGAGSWRKVRQGEAGAARTIDTTRKRRSNRSGHVTQLPYGTSKTGKIGSQADDGEVKLYGIIIAI